MRLGRILLLLSLAALLLTACSGGEQPARLAEKDNGAAVDLRVGQSLEISLPSNPTTGFGWRYAAPLNTAILAEKSSAYKQNDKPDKSVGVGGAHTWVLQAVALGTFTLRLEYLRSWEKGIAPARTFSVEVRVAAN